MLHGVCREVLRASIYMLTTLIKKRSLICGKYLYSYPTFPFCYILSGSPKLFPHIFLLGLPWFFSWYILFALLTICHASFCTTFVICNFVYAYCFNLHYEFTRESRGCLLNTAVNFTNTTNYFFFSLLKKKYTWIYIELIKKNIDFGF